MTAGPLVIELPGIPVSWARAGRNKGFSFTPAKQRHAMADLKVVAAAAMRGRKPFEGPLSVEFTFQYPWPKSVSPRKRAVAVNRWKTSRGDLDNCIKLCADGLNGFVWRDDALIVKCSAEKSYADAACTLIVVHDLAETLA